MTFGKEPADFEKWDRIRELSSLEAGYLWFDLEPNRSTLMVPAFVKAMAEEIAKELKLYPPEGKPYVSPFDKQDVSGGGLRAKASRDDLKGFAKGRRDKPAFLFPNQRKKAGGKIEIFDPDSDTYPPELDAANQAWRYAVNNRTPTKSPKSLALTFLDNNYPNFGRDMKERIATVANWDKAGGAPGKRRKLTPSRRK